MDDHDREDDYNDIFPSTQDTNDDPLEKLKVHEIDTINELIKLLGPLDLNENTPPSDPPSSTGNTSSPPTHHHHHHPFSTSTSSSLPSLSSKLSNLSEIDSTDDGLFWPTKEARDQFILIKERSKLFTQAYENDYEKDEKFIAFDVPYDTNDIPPFPTDNGQIPVTSEGRIGKDGKHDEYLDEEEETDRSMMMHDDTGSTTATTNSQGTNVRTNDTSKIMYDRNNWFKASCTEEEALADIHALLGLPSESRERSSPTTGTMNQTVPLSPQYPQPDVPVSPSSSSVYSNTVTSIRSTVPNQDTIDEDDDI